MKYFPISQFSILSSCYRPGPDPPSTSLNISPSIRLLSPSSRRHPSFPSLLVLVLLHALLVPPPPRSPPPDGFCSFPNKISYEPNLKFCEFFWTLGIPRKILFCLHNVRWYQNNSIKRVQCVHFWKKFWRVFKHLENFQILLENFQQQKNGILDSKG